MADGWRVVAPDLHVRGARDPITRAGLAARFDRLREVHGADTVAALRAPHGPKAAA